MQLVFAAPSVPPTGASDQETPDQWQVVRDWLGDPRGVEMRQGRRQAAHRLQLSAGLSGLAVGWPLLARMRSAGPLRNCLLIGVDRK
jgi:hypothetical protein